MKYYIVSFTGGVTKKFISEDGENIFALIYVYLHSQNKGEAKSDRLYFKHLSEVTKENFDNHFMPGN